jgi:hypothetical protein
VAEQESTIDQLLKLGLQTKEIEIEGIRVKIRPLTWGMERDISRIIGEMEQRGEPEKVRDREYMKLVMLHGVIDPLEEHQIEQLELNVVTTIALEILDFTGGIGKKS